MRYIWWVILCLGFISCAHNSIKHGAVTSDATTGSIKLDVHSYQLANGLKLLVLENHQLPIFSYYTYFNVGGRYEMGKTTGATHFLEHLMFKGTKNYPFGVFDSVIEGNGGYTNAFTTFDQTVYHEALPVKLLEQIISMEVDRMHNLVIKPDLFEKERHVILEERKMRYENSPAGSLYLRMMQEIYQGTPYGGSVIGEVQNLLDFTPEIIKEFYNQFYAPNNAVVVVVGDVDAEKVYHLVKRYYGKLPKSLTFQKIKEQRDRKELYQFRTKFKRDVDIWSSSPRPIILMTFKGFSIEDDDSLIADLLAMILSGSTNSYLVQKYVQGKHPVLSSISLNNHNLKMQGNIFFYGQLLPKANLKRVKRMLKQEYRSICEKGIDQRSLLRAKNQLLLEYFKGIQTNGGIASLIGRRESLLGDYKIYQHELDIYERTTLEDVKRVCHKIFDRNEYIFLTSWNKNPHKKGN